MFFVSRKNWFGLSQTEGAEYVPEPIPDFDLARALAKLEITQKPFAIVDGNTQGYAIPRERVIAISPIAFDPTKTGIHEAAHVLLHGDEGQLVDTDRPERSTREVEAELTAYLVKAALGIEKGQEFSRGYIQNWLAGTQTEKVRFPSVFRSRGQDTEGRTTRTDTPGRARARRVGADPVNRLTGARVRFGIARSHTGIRRCQHHLTIGRRGVPSSLVARIHTPLSGTGRTTIAASRRQSRR